MCYLQYISYELLERENLVHEYVINEMTEAKGRISSGFLPQHPITDYDEQKLAALFTGEIFFYASMTGDSMQEFFVSGDGCNDLLIYLPINHTEDARILDTSLDKRKLSYLRRTLKEYTVTLSNKVETANARIAEIDHEIEMLKTYAGVAGERI